MANLVGHRAGKVEYLLLMLGTYAMVPVLAALGLLPWWCMLSWLTSPLAFKVAARIMKSTPRDFPDAGVEHTAQLHLLFGVLLVMGLFIG